MTHHQNNDKVNNEIQSRLVTVSSWTSLGNSRLQMLKSDKFIFQRNQDIKTSGLIECTQKGASPDALTG